jgi:hypothetical protein
VVIACPNPTESAVAQQRVGKLAHPGLYAVAPKASVADVTRTEPEVRLPKWQYAVFSEVTADNAGHVASCNPAGGSSCEADSDHPPRQDRSHEEHGTNLRQGYFAPRPTHPLARRLECVTPG